MDRLNEIVPKYFINIPEQLEFGIIYISEKYSVAIHLCVCGCGKEVVTPFNDVNEWNLIKEGESIVSLTPSIGNWRGEKPSYHVHYYVTRNKIVWCS